jgi:hypothetical protein
MQGMSVFPCLSMIMVAFKPDMVLVISAGKIWTCFLTWGGRRELKGGEQKEYLSVGTEEQDTKKLSSFWEEKKRTERANKGKLCYDVPFLSNERGCAVSYLWMTLWWTLCTISSSGAGMPVLSPLSSKHIQTRHWNKAGFQWMLVEWWIDEQMHPHGI